MASCRGPYKLRGSTQREFGLSSLINLQNFREAVGYGSIFKRVENGPLGILSDYLEEISDVRANPAPRWDIGARYKELLILSHGTIDIAQSDLVGWPAEANPAAFALRRSEKAITIERHHQRPDKTWIRAKSVRKRLARTAKAIVLGERYTQHHLNGGRKTYINHRLTLNFSLART
jgi:hypothetical protein